MTAVKQLTLHSFEGRQIQRTAVKIVGAGDGLSEALNIDPDEIELEDERFYILRGKCARVSMETDKNGITSRVHTMKTEAITAVDDDLAVKILAEAAEDLLKAKSEAAGQTYIGEDDDEVDDDDADDFVGDDD